MDTPHAGTPGQHHPMRGILICALLGTASPAIAIDCEEAWLMRNLIFDRAGYCFGSPLGQALFDNADCTTTAPKLSPVNAAKVAEIRQFEEGCSVDTSQTFLNARFIAHWMRMEDFPTPDWGESACFGWTGPVLTVRAGHDADAPVLGAIKPGDTISFGEMAEQGWEFIRYDRGVGWIAPDTFHPDFCTQLAG